VTNKLESSKRGRAQFVRAILIAAFLAAGSAAHAEERVQSLLLRAVSVTYDLERSLLFYRDILEQELVEDNALDAERSSSWLDVSRDAKIRFVVLRGSGEYPGGPIAGGRIAFIAIVDPQRPLARYARPNRRGVHGDTILPHRVQGLDVIHQKLKAAGFEILFGPRVSPTGRSRNMMVFDPNGHIVELFELITSAVQTPNQR
jgi:catechol 2,3-dioxygenase-like lactoylglutathione lyase family enzyme